MHDGLVRIAREYATAVTQPFNRHPLAGFLRTELPTRVSAALGPVAENYRIVGSAGQGRWSDSPWVAVLDPLVTDSAMRGYYPVYLYSQGFEQISLVLGQGTYSVRNEFGARGASILRDRAEIVRARVPEYVGHFDAGPFPVISNKAAGGDWSTASIFGRTYEIAHLPPTEELATDLHSMLRLYNIATARGGYVLAADEEHEQAPPPGPGREEWEDGEKRLRQHEAVERRRNSSLVRRVKELQGHECRGCGFTFAAVYGEAGRGFIEAHHLVPLGDLTEDGPVARDPERDFAVLCSNCHRMIHALKCPSIEDFRRAMSTGYREALARFLGRRGAVGG